MSKNDCKNAGEATDGEVDGDGDVGEAVVREDRIDAELRVRYGRDAEHGGDDEARELSQPHDGVGDQRG